MNLPSVGVEPTTFALSAGRSNRLELTGDDNYIYFIYPVDGEFLEIFKISHYIREHNPLKYLKFPIIFVNIIHKSNIYEHIEVIWPVWGSNPRHSRY